MRNTKTDPTRTGRPGGPVTLDDVMAHPLPPLGPPISDEEIEEAIASDPDAAPIVTSAQMRNATRIPSEQTKVLVSLRIDADVLAELRASGPGWQTRVNALLRAEAEASRGDTADSVSPLAAVERIQITMNDVIDSVKKQLVRERLRKGRNRSDRT